ncbi:MAG: EpsI family protein [Burkholderiaceae bacterium]|nr:EpsI family protein [Burkholderiaceae bacterium]
MNGVHRNLLLLLAMVLAAGLSLAMTPTHRIADEQQKVELESLIPANFGPWHMQKQGAQIVTPEQKETLHRIYSQTLTRSYQSDRGEVIMLSIAYGADQSDDKQLHYPEVCYPAQGFQVLRRQKDVLKTAYGDIKVKRLLTAGSSRTEPLTYWSTVGNKVVSGTSDTKLEQLRYGFRGQIPDGLLFRVSTITSDTASAYAAQDNFVRSLLSALSAPERLRLAGLSGTGAGVAGAPVVPASSSVQ